MIESYKIKAKKISVIWALSLGLAFFVAFSQYKSFAYVFVLLLLGSFLAFYFSLGYYLKAKGRSLWWLLLPFFLNIVGVIVVFLLPDLTDSSSGDLIALENGRD